MAAGAERNGRGQPKETSKSPSARPARRPRRWRLLSALAVLAVIVWSLPIIIADTPIFAWILKQATTDLNGSLTVQSASLGWFSPIGLTGVELKDKEGKPVATVASLGGEHSLAAILCDYTNLGTFHVYGATASVVLRDDGSNVEDVLAKYLAPAKKKEEVKKTPTEMAIGLDLVDASLSVADQITGRKWQVHKISVKFNMAKGVPAPLIAAITAELPDEGRVAKLTAGVKMSSGVGEATLSVGQLPLALFRPLAARFSPGINVAGRLSSEMRASWGGAKGKNAGEANFTLDGFAMASTALLQSDVLQLDRLQAGCQASWQPDRLYITNSTIDCDFGSAKLVCTVPLGQKEGMSLKALAHEHQECSGRLDLARLARVLPATLHLRPGMQIDSGLVEWTLGSGTIGKGDGTEWDGQLEVANLAATDNGRKIAWQKPLSATLKAHQDSNTGRADAEPIIDQLLCEADFLKFQAAGTSDRLTATLAFDLGKLAEQLGQFIDLGKLQFAGEGSGSLTWNRTPQQQFDAGGQLQLHGFQLFWPSQSPNQPPWREEYISASLSANAKGQTDLGTNTRIDAALLGVKAGADEVDAKITQPVANLSSGGTWPVSIHAQGQLQAWPARLAAWLPTANFQIGNWQVVGGYAIDADGLVSKDGAELRQARFAAAPQIATSSCRFGGQLSGTASLRQTARLLHAESAVELANLTVVDPTGKQFQEPLVRLSANGDYDPKSKAFLLAKCELASSALAAGAAGRVDSAGGKNNAQFDGQVNYDLQRLCDLLRPYLGPSIQVGGRGLSQVWYRGPFDLKTGSAATTLRWSAANLCGLSLGPGELKATVANGAVQVAPIDLAVSQGRVHLAPLVRLTPDPMFLSLPKGPLVERIQIDPAMCASLLKYVAPALADVLDVHGSFSVDIDSCRIPLGDPTHSDVVGRLTAHAVQIGKSPMTDELAVLLGGKSACTIRPDSVVSFKMENGRVYHEGLELQFPGLAIRTHGWVGLDEKLDIVADMPVPPKWLAGNTLVSQAIRNQTISLPIKGTLKRPEIDRAEMARLNQQFLRQAAGNVIQGGLNQLFGPKK